MCDTHLRFVDWNLLKESICTNYSEKKHNIVQSKPPPNVLFKPSTISSLWSATLGEGMWKINTICIYRIDCIGLKLCWRKNMYWNLNSHCLEKRYAKLRRRQTPRRRCFLSVGPARLSVWRLCFYLIPSHTQSVVAIFNRE